MCLCLEFCPGLPTLEKAPYLQYDYLKGRHFRRYFIFYFLKGSFFRRLVLPLSKRSLAQYVSTLKECNIYCISLRPYFQVIIIEVRRQCRGIALVPKFW